MKRPLLTPIIFFLLGIFLSKISALYTISSHLPSVILALVLLLTFSFFFLSKNKVFFTSLCLFFFLLGAFRFYSSLSPQELDISRFARGHDKKMVIYGTITSPPEETLLNSLKTIVFPVEVKRVITGGIEEESRGKVLVRSFLQEEIPQVGDNIAVKGTLSLSSGRMNPAGFDYRAHLDSLGISAAFYSKKEEGYLITGRDKSPVLFIRRLLSSARTRSDGIFKKFLSPLALPISESVVLGKRSGITSDVKDVFIKTGTMHILAVSGLHVGIVAFVLLAFLRVLRCPRKFAYLLTIIGIYLFAVFAGSRPSSLRAAIMGSFLLLALLSDRKSDIINSLFLSALVITFFTPKALFMPGFILSYAAVLSIIYMTPLTDGVMNIPSYSKDIRVRAKIKWYTLKSISVSLAVWLGMMPLIAYYFRIITPSVIFTNLLAVPVLFVVIALGFSLLLVGGFALLAPVAVFLGMLLGVIVNIFIASMEFISRIPFTQVGVGAPDKAVVVLFYLVLILAVIYSKRLARGAFALVAVILVAANLFVWSEVFTSAPSQTRVTFFHSGKADSAVLEFPDGSTLLVDAGSSGTWTGSDAGKGILMPYLRERGIRNIDCVIITHPHEDHFGGLLYLLKNFNIGSVIEGGSTPNEENDRMLYDKMLEGMQNRGVKRLTVKEGDVITGFSGIDIAVLSPPGENYYKDPNNDSVVIKAVIKNGSSILFCGDIGSSAMKNILRFGSFLQSDVIKVPHHGMRLGEDTSSIREFFKMAGSKYAVITNNKDKNLNKDMLRIFDSEGTKIYVTGEEGSVTIEGLDVKGFADGEGGGKR